MKIFSKSKSRNLGFTLIELMVVIAIISLLSSVVLASVKEVREKAQHTKFITELKQFKIAIELYKSENNGDYPNTITDATGIDDTVNLLKSRNLFSGGIRLPPTVISAQFYSEDGYSVTCGTESNTGKNLSIGIDVGDLPEDVVIGNFAPLHYGGGLVGYYRCVYFDDL